VEGSTAGWGVGGPALPREHPTHILPCGKILTAKSNVETPQNINCCNQGYPRTNHPGLVARMPKKREVARSSIRSGCHAMGRKLRWGGDICFGFAGLHKGRSGDTASLVDHARPVKTVQIFFKSSTQKESEDS